MEQWVQLVVGPAGALIVLLLALVGSIKGWWVPGWQYRDVVRDRDRWMDTALRGLEVADRTTTVIEHDTRNTGE